MVKTIISILFILFSCLGLAQDATELKKIDSLEFALKLVKDNNHRLSILLELGENYAWTRDEKTIKTNEEAIDLAWRLNRPYEVARAYLNYRDFYEFNKDTVNLKKYIDKILSLGKQTNNGRILGLGNYNKALYMWNRNSPKAIDYFQEAENYYNKYGTPEDLGKLYMQFGYYYQNVRNNYSQALYYYRKMRDLYDKDDFMLVNSYNVLAEIYKIQSNYEKALEYYQLAVDLYEKNNRKDRGYDVMLNNLGNVYKELEDNDQALKYFDLFIKNSRRKENYFFVSGGMINKADLYLNMNDLENFRKTLNAAETEIKKNKDCFQRATGYRDIGKLYSKQGNFSKALNFYLNSRNECRGSILDENFMTTSDYYLGSTYFRLAQEPGEILQSTSNIPTDKEILLELSENYLLSASERSSVSSNLSQYTDILKLLSRVYEIRGNKEKALNYFKQYVSSKDSLQSVENRELLIQNQMQFEFDQKEKLQKAEQDAKDALAREVLAKEKNKRNLALLGGGFFLLLAGLGWISFNQKKKANEIIIREKQKSEDLLLNILPEEIAEELKEKGKSEPRYYESVTIMFTDFKEFTKLSGTISSGELIRELNYCFKAFDEIISKYGIEKIKTIGDSYMAVCGLPVEVEGHAQKMIKAAMEIRDFMEEYRIRRQAQNNPGFEMRIGINSGEVVAGIVGIKKFAYDIWGDAVNIASRMESNGFVGKINISEMTHDLVEDDFSFEYRGKVETKGKGKIKMYFVEPKSNNNRFEQAKDFILKKMAKELPKDLPYHNLNHILDVYNAVIYYAKLEEINEEDTELLKIAALFHDSGFIVKDKGHEEISCQYAEKYLPGFGYDERQIKKITEMIRATKIPQTPKNHLEEILADADLDYLGRDDFEGIANNLYLELKSTNKVSDINAWNKIQVSFFENHRYFTDSALHLRNDKKMKNLKKIKSQIKDSDV